MGGITLKLSIFAAGALVLTGCQNVEKLTEITDSISETVEQQQQQTAARAQAIIACADLCQTELVAGSVDFNTAPCLAEQVIPGWSCDLVHEPRTADDDKLENQCASFQNGVTKHLVEVDGNCNQVNVY